MSPEVCARLESFLTALVLAEEWTVSWNMQVNMEHVIELISIKNCFNLLDEITWLGFSNQVFFSKIFTMRDLVKMVVKVICYWFDKQISNLKQEKESFNSPLMILGTNKSLIWYENWHILTYRTCCTKHTIWLVILGKHNKFSITVK